jgi:V8-like Glu-specific endopeptidase
VIRRPAWLLAVAILVASPGTADARDTKPLQARIEVDYYSNRSPNRVRSYWTARRMAEARPVRQMLPGSPPRADARPPARRGPAESVAAIAPARRSPSKLAGDFTGGEVAADYKSYPYSANGKIFATTGKGQSYVCSGTAINSDNLSVVWTAAHCVYGTAPGAGWATRLTFVPAYKDGKAPFGEWPISRAWVPTAWAERQAISYDIAAIVVSPKPNGARLAELTGGRGIQWNAPRTQTFESFGYPARAPFDGQRMITCVSPSLGQGDPDGGPAPVSMECDMTAGSSGGGWVVGGEYLNSNTSHSYTNRPGVLFGPYFDEVAGQLYETASSFELPVAAQPHAMTLSLAITKRFVAHGRLLAQDGFTACGARTTVGIYRRKGSQFVRVKIATTDDDGDYRVELRARPGTYRAFVEARTVDGQGCSRAASAALRIG